MLRQRRLVGTLVISVTSLLMVFACGEDKKASCAGSERCACYPNETCDGDLVCFSHLCVMASEGGRSGTGSGGSAGESTTLGNAGAGGEGFVPPASAGSAGMDAIGGTGVEPTSGGSVGSGGAPNRGGGSGTSGGASTTSGGTSADAGQPGEGGMTDGGSTGTGIPDGSFISNGDFSAGSADWNLVLQAGGVGVSTFSNGHACIQGDLNVVFDFGWPLDTSRAFVLEPGVPYTLSFRAVAGSAFTLVIKLGHVTTPYTAAFLTNTSLTTGWASYTFPVVAASGDSATGLVFQGTLLSGNSVCFDDVSLVKD